DRRFSMTARLVLLVTSPRLPAGLLTAAALDLVRGNPGLAGADSELTAAVRAVGAEVTIGGVEDFLAAAGADGTAVWLAGPAGDEALARDIGMRLTRDPGRAELE